MLPHVARQSASRCLQKPGKDGEVCKKLKENTKTEHTMKLTRRQQLARTLLNFKLRVCTWLVLTEAVDRFSFPSSAKVISSVWTLAQIYWKLYRLESPKMVAMATDLAWNERKAEAQLSACHWMIVFRCFQMFSQRSMASIPVDSIANSALDKIWQGNNRSTTCSPYGSFPGERGCWHLLREAKQSDFEQEAKTARKPWNVCSDYVCDMEASHACACMCTYVRL